MDVISEFYIMPNQHYTHMHAYVIYVCNKWGRYLILSAAVYINANVNDIHNFNYRAIILLSIVPPHID